MLQTGRSVPNPDSLHSFAQSVSRIELPPSLGVAEPFDSAEVKVTEYYPGARCALRAVCYNQQQAESGCDLHRVQTHRASCMPGQSGMHQRHS